MISIQDIVSGKINMVPQVIKEKYIADFAGKKRNGMRDVDIHPFVPPCCTMW